MLKRIVLIFLITLLNLQLAFAQDSIRYQNGSYDDLRPIKETYQLNGEVQYDDNSIETIYLEDSVDKPQVNIPQKSLILPVGILNITSNSNVARSALARASVNNKSLSDILPLSGSVSDSIGNFSYGHLWEQELSYSQLESTSSFFLKYDTKKHFAVTGEMRRTADQDIGTQYTSLRVSPELQLTKRLKLKDSYTAYVELPKKKNSITLVYTPSLKKYADSLKFELGLSQSYYQSGQQSSELSFFTKFKL